MPFLRFSRDKRGYEHTYLIHASSKKGAPARILYWYRTPPGVKVGRAAFDPDVRKALEAQYPGVSFDWAKLMDATPPPPDAEHWRERRRQEKAARQARQAAERDDRPDESPDEDGMELAQEESPPPASDVSEHSAPASPESEASTASVTLAPAVSGDSNDPGARPRKRRRRGGRRRRKGGSADPTTEPMMGAAVPGESGSGSGTGADIGQDDDDGPGDEAPDVA